jgi:hypothetical protein
MLDKEWQDLLAKQFQERKAFLTRHAKKSFSRSEGARRLGTSASQLTFLIKKHGVDWPKAKNWLGGPKGYGKEHYQHLAENGYTKSEAANELGISYNMISKAQKAYDLNFVDGRVRPTFGRGNSKNWSKIT